MSRAQSARADLIMAALRVVHSELDLYPPGPHDDAEAEYADDMLSKAAHAYVSAYQADRASHPACSNAPDYVRRAKSDLDSVIPLPAGFVEAVHEQDGDGPREALQRAYDPGFDAVANVQAATEYVRRRYGAVADPSTEQEQ